MIRYFFLLVIYICAFANNTITVNSNTSLVESAKFSEYIVDTNNNLTAQDIINSQKLEIAAKNSFGVMTKPIWVKFKIKNNSLEPLSFMVSHSRPQLSYIDVYIFKDNELQKTYKTGFMALSETKPVEHRYSSFKLDMEPNEEVVIVSKLSSYGVMDISWNIQSLQEFFNADFIELFILGSFAGIMVALLLHNLFNYIILREKYLLFYLLHIGCGILFWHSLNGIYLQANIGVNPEILMIIPYIVGHIGIFALIMFPIYFFDIKNISPKLYRFLLFIAAIALIFVILYLYSLADISILYIQKWGRFFSAASLLVLLYVGAWGIVNHIKEAKYYFFGQSLYVAFVFYTLLTNFGFNESYILAKFAGLFGLLFDTVFIALIISMRIKSIKDKNKTLEDIGITQARFASIGEAVGSVAHQWKNPLNYLGANVLYLEALMHTDRQKFDEKLDELLSGMKEAIGLMSRTVDDFYSIYNSDNTPKQINIKQELRIIVNILAEKINKADVRIKIIASDSDTLIASRCIIANVSIILIENAIEQGAKNITVSFSKENEIALLQFKDDAGGIKVKPIEKIFDRTNGTKSTANLGLGLYIAKTLVVEKLGGSISAKNCESGSIFEIRFKAEPIPSKTILD